MQNPYWYDQMRIGQIENIPNLEEMYPEIYKIIYPMVKKACNRNIRGVSSNLIDEMTEEIYNNIETDNIVSLDINIQNVGTENNRGKESNEENLEENRRIENRKKRGGPIFDLIKILLIRELLDRRPGNRPRPPMPPRPPRPGPWDNDFPGRPPMPRF